MANFVRVIDAVQFTGVLPDPAGVQRDTDNLPFVTTIGDAQAYLSVGQWIIRDPSTGDVLIPPMADAAFTLLYSAVV